MPDNPSSLPHGEGERPIPPVEAAWAQMERKLDLAGSAGSPARPVVRPVGDKVVLQSRFRRFALWMGAAAALFAIVFVTRVAFNAKEYALSERARPAAENTAGGREDRMRSDSVGRTDRMRPDVVGGTADRLRPGAARERAGRLRTDAAGGGEGRLRTAAAAVGRGPGGSEPHARAATQMGVGSHNIQPAVANDPAVVNDPLVGVASDRLVTATAQHTRHRASPAPLHPTLAVPVAAGDSLLRMAAAKHLKGPVKIASSRLAARNRWIPRWSAGITVKQYMPLPSQQFNNFSTDGNRHVYSDYIPAVFARAAINGRSYLQAAFGFHSPQYTRDIMVGNEDLGSSTVPGYTAYLEFERSNLKKLFYNELELTYHYQIANRWRVGAGIQYAFLSGGTIENQTILHPANPALADTVYAVKRIGIGHPTGWYGIAHKTAEWRGIIEMEYCLSRWLIGLRYQQATQTFYFVNGSAAAQTVTNSSVSIRASYTLWQRDR